MIRTIVAASLLTVILGAPASAGGFQFAQTDGRNPQTNLIGDSTGSLFGTTANGGDTRCKDGCGTVFKLTPSGSRYRESILYAFRGTPDGFNPTAGLIADRSGALYGTTVYGGTYGWGTVFKLTPTLHGYVETVLYSFRGDTSGSNPQASLLEDSTGSLYGTATVYGPVIFGTVFKLTPHGSGYDYSVLHAFKAGSEGTYPSGPLIRDSSGALYGTARSAGEGGVGDGTVFKLTPHGSSYDFSVLYTFTGSNGATPLSGVIADSSGALYGTTENGGADGKGIVFKLTASGGVYSESILHSFEGDTDGHHPVAGLFGDGTGSLYGTTAGLTQSRNPRLGTVFKLAPNGSGYAYSVLHVFTGGTDGAIVDGSLIEDESGRLYGTTFAGGTTGLGTVFRLSPHANSYRKVVLHNFQH